MLTSIGRGTVSTVAIVWGMPVSSGNGSPDVSSLGLFLNVEIVEGINIISKLDAQSPGY